MNVHGVAYKNVKFIIKSMETYKWFVKVIRTRGCNNKQRRFLFLRREPRIPKAHMVFFSICPTRQTVRHNVEIIIVILKLLLLLLLILFFSTLLVVKRPQVTSIMFFPIFLLSFREDILFPFIHIQHSLFLSRFSYLIRTLFSTSSFKILRHYLPVIATQQ
jgi:hypothetical protein